MSFKGEQAKIAKKQGISSERAGAILAAGARKSSPAAIKRNPNLTHVKGAGTLYHGKNPNTRQGGSPMTGPTQEVPMGEISGKSCQKMAKSNCCIATKTGEASPM